MIELHPRPATLADIPDMTSMINNAVRIKLANGDNIWGEEDWTQQEVIDEIFGSDHAYVAVRGAKTLGTFILQPSDKRVWGEKDTEEARAAYLHKLAVQAGYEDQKLGVSTIRAAEIVALEQGKKLMRLDCEVTNKKLCGYYQKLGFMQVGSLLLTSKNPLRPNGYHAALFERPIS